MHLLAAFLASVALSQAPAVQAVQQATKTVTESKADVRSVKEREGREAKERRQRERPELRAERKRKRERERHGEESPVELGSTLKIGLVGLTGGNNGSPDKARARTPGH